ncbi:MAG: hypothetical protein C0432_03350 [Candidatus Puniceispirillum sp.]|nr:hypothetical protein [Candidatus Pelagibacter sp.]MBA4283310.1 hypothetical protein [Candidatus Puniceispirillum sp.]
MVNISFVEVCMNISNGYEKLHSKLLDIESEKKKIDEKINQTPKSESGVLNFCFYQMKKRRDEINQKIDKINSFLNPDIIA